LATAVIQWCCDGPSWPRCNACPLPGGGQKKIIA